MAPGRVDSNNKQAKSSIGRVEEELFYIDTMVKVFQFQIKLQFIWLGKHPKNYIMNVLMREKHSNFQFQGCYIRETCRQDLLWLGQQFCSIHFQCRFPRKHLHHRNSDDDSNGLTSSPKRTDVTEMKIDKSL
jgi:hypothetical protein